MTQSTLTPFASPLSREKMAYDTIKEAILTFRFKPGECLVESDLALQLNISKTPVRESLTRLEREGFITKISYKGYYVTEISRKGMLDIFDIRAVLEGLAMQRAANLITRQDIDQAEELIDAHEKVAGAHNIVLASQYNRRFHDLLVRSADNERLIKILANLDDHLRRYRLLSNYQAGRLEKSVVEHRQILDAIIRHDGEEADRATRHHILSVSYDLANEDFDRLVDQIVNQE